MATQKWGSKEEEEEKLCLYVCVCVSGCKIANVRVQSIYSRSLKVIEEAFSHIHMKLIINPFDIAKRNWKDLRLFHGD